MAEGERMLRLREITDQFNGDEGIIAACYVLDCSPGRIRLHLDDALSAAESAELSRILAERRSGKPLQYAIGRWSFFGRDFKVDARALIPRPETELLVERVLNFGTAGKRICDVGTGTGIIPLTLAMETTEGGRFPNASPSVLIGGDISEEALNLARENDRLLRGEAPALPIHWKHSDVLEEIDGPIDLLISNPPYISESAYGELEPELFHEPRNALVAEHGGLSIYERLVAQAERKLAPGGAIFFEIGFDQAMPIRAMLEEHGFTDIAVHKDYNGFDRIVHARKLTD